MWAPHIQGAKPGLSQQELFITPAKHFMILFEGGGVGGHSVETIHLFKRVIQFGASGLVLIMSRFLTFVVLVKRRSCEVCHCQHCLDGRRFCLFHRVALQHAIFFFFIVGLLSWLSLPGAWESPESGIYSLAGGGAPINF